MNNDQSVSSAKHMIITPSNNFDYIFRRDTSTKNAIFEALKQK